jgi:cytochrome P450
VKKIGDITNNNVDSLVYTRAVFLEGLRYSGGIFPLLTRQALKDDTIGDYVVKQNDKIIIPISNTLKHAEFWQNPQGFDPTRFLNIDLLDERHRFTYLAFSAGLHGCAGRNFAILQSTLILALVTNKYRLDLMPFQQLDFMKPEKIMMTVHKL